MNQGSHNQSSILDFAARPVGTRQPLIRHGAIVLTEIGIMLMGPQSRTTQPNSDRDLLLVRELTPGDWHNWLQMHAESYADEITPMPEHLLSSAEDVFRFVSKVNDPDHQMDMIEAWIANSMAATFRGPYAPTIAAIDEAIRFREIRTAEMLCHRLGINHARLTRLCTRNFGFTPKLLLRRERFLRSFAAVRNLPRGMWASAIDPAYVDQSHFIRDAHRFLGMTPSRFLALDAHIQPLIAAA